jgi:hypothetical protein
MTKNNKDSKIIECHEDLIKILEDLKSKISSVTYGALNKPSYKELTFLLSKKIEKLGGIK